MVPDAGAARTLRRCPGPLAQVGCSCRPARVAVRSRRGAVLLAGLRGRGHRPLRCICRGRHRRFGDEPGGFVMRAGHRLQDGRDAGRDAGTAAGEARPAGARLLRCVAQGGL